MRLTGSKEELKRYFINMKKIKRLMLLRAEGGRTYMPTTFDEMMVDFGIQ
jgi:hypothetical protein